MVPSRTRAAVRTIVIWAIWISLEHAIYAVRGPASGARFHDWLTGELIGLPVSLALLAPAALLIALLARWIAGRRALLVASLVAVAALPLGYMLSRGPSMTAPGRRGPFIVGLAGIVFTLAYALVRYAPLERRRVLAGLGVGVAVAALVVDHNILTGLYPAFHVALVAIQLASIACAALVVPHLRSPVRPRVWAALVAIMLVWTGCALRRIDHDEAVRQTLVQHPMVLAWTSYAVIRLLPAPRARRAELDPQLAELARPQELPRSLDWSGCDMLLVTVDALRADHLGAYGYQRPTTPQLDKLAAQGTRFEHAYTAVPKTSYALSSIMAGKNMRRSIASGQTKDTKLWAEHLRDLGYATMAIYDPLVFIVDGHLLADLRGRGLGFEVARERSADVKELRSRLATYLDSAPRDTPVFVWTHVFEPHTPYVPHPEAVFGTEPIDVYDSEIAAADAFIGDAVALIRRRGSRCAAIVVTADHGEAFDEHGTSYHGNNVYEEQVRVPLIVVGPGVRAGGVIRPPVQTIDLLPTVLAALGQHRPTAVTGRDLGPLLAGSDDPTPGLAFSEVPRYSMTALGSERLICDGGVHACALYDLENDPTEQRAIRDRPARVAVLRKLADVLAGEHAPPPKFPLRFAATSLAFRRTNVREQGGRLVVTDAADSVLYGPYIQMPPGSYEAIWRGSGMRTPGRLVFSVRNDYGRETYIQKVVEAASLGDGELVTLPFALDRQRFSVEFSVQSANGAMVTLDDLTIVQTAQDPAALLQRPHTFAATAPSLRHARCELRDERVIATGEEGTIIYGPYIQLPRGAYELRWTGEGMGGPGQIVFSITADAGQEILARVAVDAAAIPDHGDAVILPFVLDRLRSQIEFVVQSTDGGRVTLDHVVVEQVPDARGLPAGP